MKVKSS